MPPRVLEVEVLELRADVEGVAEVGGALELAAQDEARVAFERAAVGVVDVAEHARDARLRAGRQGTSWKVVGSGMAIMSDSSMRAKPSMDEPSKPMPSSRAFSSSSTVMAKLLRAPTMSVNQSRMNLTAFSRQAEMT